MAEQFLTLKSKDRAEILEIAASKTGRPAHLLEKDIWVVRVLSVLFKSAVAQHKSFFFIEKDVDGNRIDYSAAISGELRIVPEHDAYDALQNDYMKMIEDGVLVSDTISFQFQNQINDRQKDQLIQCVNLEMINLPA